MGPRGVFQATFAVLTVALVAWGKWGWSYIEQLDTLGPTLLKDVQVLHTRVSALEMAAQGAQRGSSKRRKGPHHAHNKPGAAPRLAHGSHAHSHPSHEPSSHHHSHHQHHSHQHHSHRHPHHHGHDAGLAPAAPASASAARARDRNFNLLVDDMEKRREHLHVKPASEQVARCISATELDASVVAADPSGCTLQVRHPAGTRNVWVYHKTGKVEPLDYTYNLCAYMYQFSQMQHVSPFITREFLHALPNAADFLHRRSNRKIGGNKLLDPDNKFWRTLPERPPVKPNQYKTCAVVGSSGDLTAAEFGAEIDAHDAIFRINDAPTKRWAKHVGSRTDYRVLNNMGWQGKWKVENNSEVVLMKGDLHDSFIAQMGGAIRAYFLHVPKLQEHAAGGTGTVAIVVALSMCAQVNVYGFSTEPGYKQWTRYFSGPGAGHHPLRGRAYYQVLDCIGAISVKAPSRPPTHEPLALATGAAMVRDGFGLPDPPCRHTARSAAVAAAAAEASPPPRQYVQEINGAIHYQTCVA